jgi:hypothetical protein
MPEDDWDLAEVDEAGEGDDAAGAAANDKAVGVQDPGPDAISAEEREAVRALRETGMAPAEVIARARRDYQQETHSRAANDKPAAADTATDDPDAVLTKGEADKMLADAKQEVRQEARMETLQVQQYNAMQDIVAEETSKGLGEMPGYKCKAIADEVASRLGKNVKLLTLPQPEFAKEVHKVAKQVIDEERKLAAGIAGVADAAELDNRLEAQVNAGESGARGGSGKRSAKQGRVAEMRERVQEPPHGVSESRSWPSDAEIEDLHMEEMKEHRANVKAGRV